MATASHASATTSPRSSHHTTTRAITTASTLSVLRAINALRAQYGLSRAQLTSGYNSEVAIGATKDADPALDRFGPGAVEEYGLWGIAMANPGSTAVNPASVVSEWVYDDGWQGSKTENLDCTSPSAPGCNGHRRAVLSGPPARGDKLDIDVVVRPTNWSGYPAVSVAMIMVWGAPISTVADVTETHSTTGKVARTATRVSHSTRLRKVTHHALSH